MTWHPALIIAFLTGLDRFRPYLDQHLRALAAVDGRVFRDRRRQRADDDQHLHGVVRRWSADLRAAVRSISGGVRCCSVGLTIFVVTTVMIIVAPSIVRSVDLVIVGRGLQALGACSGPVVARAIMRDLYSREETAKVMAYIALAMGLAPAFAPVLGGYLEVWFDWRASFVRRAWRLRLAVFCSSLSRCRKRTSTAR